MFKLSFIYLTVLLFTAEARSDSDWRLFGGFGMGLGSVFSSENQSALTGEQILLNGAVSYQLPKWVFDGGAAWLYTRVSGTGAQTLPIQIRTRNGMMELSPRYRLSDRWQLGPIYSLAFGTDTGFGPSIQDSIGSSFLGLKAVYEFPHPRFPFRLFSQVSTDISISSRQVWFAFLGAQIGLDLRGKNATEETPLHLVAAAPASTGHMKKTTDLRIVLNPKKVFFHTNSSRIRPEEKRILEDVGNYLKSNNQDWDFLEISGHADQRGRFDYNLKLSKKRASAVKNAILHAEFESEKVKVQSFSYLKPLDARNNPAAWSRNRRVEIVFRGVTHPEILSEKLRPLTEDSKEDL